MCNDKNESIQKELEPKNKIYTKKQSINEDKNLFKFKLTFLKWKLKNKIWIKK